MELKILEVSASHAFGMTDIIKKDAYTSVIDEYDFDSTDLSNYNVLVITYFVDQEYLYKHKQIIEDFLNEGKVVVIVDKEDANKVLNIMKENPVGKNSAIIGEAINDGKNKVYLKTLIGGKRIVNMPEGELLVRIC